MKILLISLMIVSLTGCSTVVPVTMKFPDAPETLMEPAEKLSTLKKDKVELSDIIENANENAGKYYKLREKYRAWQEWYTEQKKITNDLK